jgi:flagellar hook-associated protein 3 FlgL
MQQLETQLSTGQQFQLPSEDPAAAIRVIGIQRELEFKSQTLRNLDSAQGYLNVTETNLGNVQDLMTELRGLGLEAIGNVVGDVERTGWINQIDATIDRLMAVANSKYLDRYLFSGGSVGTPTVQKGREGVRFTGNEMNLLGIAAVGDYIAHNVTGQKALGLVSQGVVGRVDLNPVALATTRLSDLNRGEGISPGAIQFSDGTNQVIIDLANAESLDDVLTKVNGTVSLGGREISLSLSNGVLVADYADGNPGTLRITDVGTGRAATDLGIATSGPLPPLPISSGPLHPILRTTTQLSQLNDGAGFNWGEGLQIQQGDQLYSINFSDVGTIEDVLGSIHRSGASVVADISPDGRGLRIRSTESGSSFSISELNGTLAESLGLKTFHEQTQLSELNFGRGIATTPGHDIVIVRNDGTELNVDLENAKTIEDVLNTINNHVDNQDAATKIVASLKATGNGIQISSEVFAGPPPPSAGPIRIRTSGGSQAAWDLGLVERGQAEAVATTIGSEYIIQGSDSNPQEVKGIFNSLTRLRDAIAANDTTLVTRAVSLIDEDLSRLSLSRGSLGVEQQRIDSLKSLQEDQEIELKADKSRNLEADMTEVISNLNAYKIAYEASLKLLANANQTSLFNFL